MSGEIVAAIIGAAAAAISGLLVAAFAWPKTRAEAHKASVEAAGLEWQALKRELDRLTERVTEQDDKIAGLERQLAERDDRELELERENKRLRQEIGRLKTRVEGLEAILRVTALPADMQAQLDELDRKTRDKP